MSVSDALTFGSVCSGIGGAEVAWSRLGWRSRWCAEIDPFASAVLAARFPRTPNLGDFTKIRKGVDADAVDVLGGGTPCQSFSVAGLRKGLDDARGDLTLEFLGLVGRLLPRWVVWENVPGVLSIDGGRTFGAVLGLLGELGYGFAYRVLDAQYFGLAQRRRRVFVVAYRGDWRPPAAVLFEREGMCGDSPPRREAGAGTAGASGVRAAISSGRGWWNDADVGATVRAQDSITKADTLVTHSLRADGFDASEDGTGRGTPLVAYQQHGSDVGEAGALRRGRGDVQSGVPFVAFDCKAGANTGFAIGDIPGALRGEGHGGGHAAILTPFDPTQLTHPENRSNPQPGDPAPTLPKDGHGVAIAFDTYNQSLGGEVSQSLRNPNGTFGDALPAVMTASAVRRLTPKECERLQGFPDDWTLVPYRGKPAADGPRYRAIGNAWPVPVVEWIGARIALCDTVLREAEVAA